MPTSPNDFNPAPLRESLLAFLWRQWAVLGVAGTSQTGDPWVVDPEALLIFTAGQARHDPRLFDEVLSWTLHHEADLNLQRLTALLEALPWGDTSPLGALAAKVALDQKNPRWEKLSHHTLPVPPREPQPFFLFSEGNPHPLSRNADPVFLRYGWSRPTPQLRNLSVAINPGRAETLIFTLRAFFGIQARAEIFAWLLCREGGRPADIARATGYRSRTVETTLADMAGSGQVLSARAGREKHYRIARARWKMFLPDGEPPQWVEWAPLFVVFARLLAVLDKTELLPVLRDAELKKVFGEVAAPLAGAGRLPLFTVSDSLSSPEFASRLMKDLLRIAQVLASPASEGLAAF